MSYIWFWVHWLLEHRTLIWLYLIWYRLTVRDPRERAKFILKLFFSGRLTTVKEDYQTKENCKNVLYLILGALIGKTRPKIS